MTKNTVRPMKSVKLLKSHKNKEGNVHKDELTGIEEIGITCEINISIKYQINAIKSQQFMKM